MSLWNTVKGWFMEDTSTQHVIAPRAAMHNLEVDPESGIITGITANRFTTIDADDSLPTRKLKGWVASALGSAPWVAVAVILFAAVSHGAIATAALGYGLLKVSIAVLLTVIADETMFRGMKDSSAKWLPAMRRSAVFMGICWLMAVT